MLRNDRIASTDTRGGTRGADAMSAVSRPGRPRWRLRVEQGPNGRCLDVVDTATGRVVRQWRGPRAEAILTAPIMQGVNWMSSSPAQLKDAVHRVFLAAAQSEIEAAPLLHGLDGDLAGVLRSRGLTPTHQRQAVARALARHGGHPSADELHRALRRTGYTCSRATIYNSLSALVRCGLAREVVVEPGRVHYDPVIQAHPHVHNIDTGEVSDLDPEYLPALAGAALPEGTELESVSLVVRVRSRQRARA